MLQISLPRPVTALWRRTSETSSTFPRAGFSVYLLTSFESCSTSWPVRCKRLARRKNGAGHVRLTFIMGSSSWSFCLHFASRFCRYTFGAGSTLMSGYAPAVTSGATL